MYHFFIDATSSSNRIFKRLIFGPRILNPGIFNPGRFKPFSGRGSNGGINGRRFHKIRHDFHNHIPFFP